MTTLELRNLYAKKISKSLNKVLEQIDLLNNIDNNIILNNNFVGSESKIYNNNLYGGAEIKADATECELKPFDDIQEQLQNSLTTYDSIEENINRLINQYKTQIQAKDSALAQQQQQIDQLRNSSADMITKQDHGLKIHQYIIERDDIIKDKKRLELQVNKLGDALKKCTDCKNSYLQKVNEMRMQVDSNNNAVSELLAKVQSQLQSN